MYVFGYKTALGVTGLFLGYNISGILLTAFMGKRFFKKSAPNNFEESKQVNPIPESQFTGIGSSFSNFKKRFFGLFDRNHQGTPVNTEVGFTTTIDPMAT